MFSAVFLASLSLVGLAVGATGTGQVKIPGADSKPSYNIEGSIVLSGTTDGAEIKANSFSYTATESSVVPGLSFVGPSTDLSFTGAENLDFSIKLIDEESGNVVRRDEQSIEELPVRQEESVDFRFTDIPEGDYRMEFDLKFECTALTWNCKNRDTYSADVSVGR